MESLVDAVAEADSWHSLVAIGLIGLFVMLWRWGGRLLDLVQQVLHVTEQAAQDASDAREQVDRVASSIVTNHGSKNLGESVDRITEWLVQHMEEARHRDEMLADLQRAFLSKMVEGDHRHELLSEKVVAVVESVERLTETVGEVAQRVEQLEQTSLK